jgi:3-oxoacyl-[acyl-carrier protein] reductase
MSYIPYCCSFKSKNGIPLFLCLLALIVLVPSLSAMASSSSRLAGQRVLVTGGGRGIGRAMALIFSREGAKVAISSRTRSELEETMALAGPHVCMSKDESSSSHSASMDMYVADVTNVESVESMVKSIVEKWGGIDILINNAGRGQAHKGTLETLDANEFHNLLLLNVVSVHIVTSSVLRHAMLPAQRGKIINVSSKAGKMAIPHMSQYCASKFALEGMTATMAADLQDKNIQVNSLSPGMVNTQSFPKPDGKKGVRSAESVEDGLMALLMDDRVTGHYLHVDELDQARAKGLQDRAAMKPINEAAFNP